MSDEEKKAIAYLKFYIERDVMYEDTHYEQIKTILNLIEKQSKEIEELKEQCKEVVCIPEGTCFMLKPKDVDKKWKDKINEKIEEYEEILDSPIIKEDYKLEVQHIIGVLKELKGDN